MTSPPRVADELREKMPEAWAELSSPIRAYIIGIVQALENSMIEQGVDPADRRAIDGVILGVTLANADIEHLETGTLLMCLSMFAPEPGLSWRTPDGDEGENLYDMTIGDAIRARAGSRAT